MAYRRRQGVADDASAVRMAVLVQKMLRPEAAGVLFTRGPGAEAGFVLIQAVEGSGEALARGGVTPAALKVSREGGAATGEAGGDFPLEAAQVRNLVGLSLRLEAAWGCPLDLEWAVEAGQLRFVQARPVTAITPDAALDVPAQPAVPPTEDTLWTRANFRELLPDLPSPLFVSFSDRLDWEANSRRLGMKLRPGERPFRFIEGRPYFNLSLIARLGDRFGFPVSQFTRALGHDAELSSLAGRATRPFRAFLRSPGMALRMSLFQMTVKGRLKRFFVRVRREAERLRRLDPPALSDGDLMNLLRASNAHNTEFVLNLQLAFNRVLGALLIVESLLPQRVEREAFLGTVLAAGDKSVSLRQGTELIGLSLVARKDPRVVMYLKGAVPGFTDFNAALDGTGFLREFQAYVAEYGHRGIHESDPAMPIYSEDPAFLLGAVAALVSDPHAPDPAATARAQEETAASSWNNLRRHLPAWERAFPLRPVLLKRAVKTMKEAIALREQTRFEGMRVNAALRRFLREAGTRLHHRGHLESTKDLPLLRIEDIEGALEGKLAPGRAREILRQRRAERERLKLIAMPNLLRESEISGLEGRRPPAARDAGSFQGLPVGPGRVEGRVVVLESPRELDRVIRGDILVTSTLDPSWIPLFTLVSGLVVEMGGTLSHGSIIAREYGLPTVVNLPGITRILRTGDRVLLDGGSGTLKRVEPVS